MLATNVAVFISYSHDSPQHKARVLELADRLRADGLNCIIDQYDDETPAEGWPLWMDKQIHKANFVLMVCTETYYRRVMGDEQPGKGLGARWEGHIILQHLYNHGVFNTKFIPILFAESDEQYILTPVAGVTRYRVDTKEGYEVLYSRLTNQPLIPKTEIGTIRKVQPHPRAALRLPSGAALRPKLVHPYALQANFTGRVNERQELTAWLADDAHPICVLIAMGGMGKSALAWYWMQKDLLPNAAAATVEGIMWWSFYEGESSFAKFVDEALKYVSGQQAIDAALFPTTYDRAQELRSLLQHKRVLLILDGFERQLRAYASLDAAYQHDDTTNLSRDERACVDPVAARLLSDIASITTRAKVLLTTRLMVRDLEDRAGDALAGVLKRELEGLPRDDAVKFMRDQGVTKGTPAEIAAACATYGYHPLSLRLLSGLIAHDKRKPGDISAAPRHDVHANLIRQRQHHVLEQSYNALSEKERVLLSRIAAFRSPMTYDALLIFNTLGNEARFDAALEVLRMRGLLQHDTKNNRYNLHPLVRRYAYDRLTDKMGVHTRLLDYFANIPAPDANKVQSIEDLLPVIELYHHTASAGRYDEACNLLKARLIPNPLYFRFGVYQTCIELLRALFPNSEEYPPRLGDENAKAWTLNVLALSYSFSGQPRRAVPLFEHSIALRRTIGDKKNVAIGLGNIAVIAQIPLGELAAAENNLRRSIELCREIKKEHDEAPAHQALGRLLAYRGAFDEAAGELEILEPLL
jgi:tetratricopeptide (TPR) repeat protein